MAKPRPEKKPEPAAPGTTRILPIQLQLGDRVTDATGEWEVITRPYVSAGGKLASAHVRKIGRPETTDADLERPRAHRSETRGGEVNEERDTDERLWHPWLRINRVLRAMLTTRRSAEAWPQAKAEFKKALALRSEIRRAGWFN